MLRTLLIALVLTFTPALLAIAGTPATSAGFLSQTDCFEATPDYESWLESLPQRADGPPLSKALVQSLVPAKAFAFARAAFDCRIVTHASGGQTVSGYVVRLKTNPSAGKQPLLIYNRGGNGDFGKLDALHVFQTLLPLAKAGHVVAATRQPAGINPCFNLRQIPCDVSAGEHDATGKLSALLHVVNRALCQRDHRQQFLAVDERPVRCCQHAVFLQPL